MIEYWIENQLYVNQVFELLAALAGSWYLRKIKPGDRTTRLFINYLWFIFWLEIVGMYAAWNYFDHYKTFPFLKDSPFAANYWMYNISKIIGFVVYFRLFISRLRSARTKNILNGLSIFFVLSCILNLIFSDVYFKGFSVYTSITGALLVLTFIGFYYYQMLTSKELEKFYRSPYFYFSLGILLWHVFITPLFIYNRYFSMKSPEFVQLHMDMLRYANIFMYSCFAGGFIVSYLYSRKKPEPAA